MPQNPNILIDRPNHVDEQATDVLADLIASLRLSTLIHGRLELGAPWGLRFPGHLDAASLYVVSRGGAELLLESEKKPTVLSAGDVALLPHGGTHILRDGKRSPLHTLGEGQCRRSTATEPIRLGGEGARTTILAAAFRFGAAHRTLLFSQLPPIIHISAADEHAAPWLSSLVQLLLAESARRSPGGSVVLSRLADVLLVYALRTFIANTGCRESGLRALVDPQIGKALQLIHEHPADPWTVEGLARAVGLSRSGFASHFSELVGEPPLEYVARWRMTRAAELLRESDLPIRQIAEQTGYASEAAFGRAFKRYEGTAPATYRRQP